MIIAESAKNKDYISPEELPEKYEARFQDILNSIPEKERAGALGVNETKSIKSGLLEKYKGLEQEIEFVFSEIEQLKDQERIGKLKEYGKQGTITPGGEEEIRGIKLNLTESFFLQSAYILANRKDEDYLKGLLDLTDKIAWRLRETRAWRGIRKGLLGEVGLYRLLEKRGFSPSLPHPREDANLHVDMWAETEMAVGRKKVPVKLAIQMKHTAFASKPRFLQSEDDLDAWMSEEMRRLTDERGSSEEGIARFTELAQKLKGDFREMEENCRRLNEDLSDRTAKQVEPVIVIFPEGPRENPSIDPYTGELNEEYFKNFKIELKEE